MRHDLILHHLHDKLLHKIHTSTQPLCNVAKRHNSANSTTAKLGAGSRTDVLHAKMTLPMAMVGTGAGG